MSMRPHVQRIDRRCHAKVNLALSVGAIDARGMHPIASWMAAIDIGDDLTLEKLHDGPSQFDLGYAQENDQLPSSKIDWPLQDDLTFRACSIMQTLVEQPLPVRVTLRKRIPAGSGLGGGSSDAAGVLVGINDLYGLGLGRDTLVDQAAQLGSDVAFLTAAALGDPWAIATGYGQALEPIRPAKAIDLVLIFPGFGCPTGEVYRAFDQLHTGTESLDPDLDRVISLTGDFPVHSHALFNDLAEPAFLVRPELRGIRDRISELCQTPVHVTGSGSTLFLVAPSPTRSRILADRITSKTGLHAIATGTVQRLPKDASESMANDG